MKTVRAAELTAGLTVHVTGSGQSERNVSRTGNHHYVVEYVIPEQR